MIGGNVSACRLTLTYRTGRSTDADDTFGVKNKHHYHGQYLEAIDAPVLGLGQDAEVKQFGPNFLTRPEPPRVGQKVGPKIAHVGLCAVVGGYLLGIAQLSLNQQHGRQP